MGWVLRLVETGGEGPSGSVDVLEIGRPGNLDDLADLGLRLPDGKQLLSQVQQAVVAAQCRDHAAQRPACRACGAACRVCCATIKTPRPATIWHTSNGGAAFGGQAGVKPKAARGGGPKGQALHQLGNRTS